MRTLILAAEVTPLRLRYNRDLYPRDIKGTIPTLVAGEWCQFVDEVRKKYYLGYFNHYVEAAPPGRIVSETKKVYPSSINEEDIARQEIERLLLKAFERKKIFSNYQEGFRLVHGASDELPGLVIDIYKNLIMVQINTAGIDRFRNIILSVITKLFPQQKICFLDQENYRKAEMLPKYDEQDIGEDLQISENGFKYCVPSSVLQKVGFYYDHRENRERMENKIKSINKKFKQGADLFCYAGGWGLHLLRAGVEQVLFVDQGDLSSMVNNNLEKNNFKGRGEFVRSDVFRFLDEYAANDKRFDILVSDPPAFKKNEKNKDAALAGYEKLHSKIFNVLEKEALLSICSCTHNISLEELDRTVNHAALKMGRKVYMLDIGVQGIDHSFASFADKNHYLKYILYWVETA